MNLWRSLAGVLEVELTSAELPTALTAINGVGVEINRLHWVDELTCQFQVRRSQFPAVKRLIEKRGEHLRVCGWKGLFWRMLLIRKRPVLAAGMLLFLTMTLVLPNYVLFVRVDGNLAVPDRQVLEAAEKLGVGFGASRRELRSEWIKNGLLSQIPALQWVGVNTAGCLATISVRERTALEEKKDNFQVTRIVADRDGYILSGTVERGTGLFQQGQVVRQGQLLISGYTESDYTLRATRAAGEILAQTSRQLTVVTPDHCLARSGAADVKQKVSLLIGKKRINLWKDSGISTTTCGRMYKENFITLPGGFRLPVALCVEIYSHQNIESISMEEANIPDQLSGFAKRYLEDQMIAGTIKSSQDQIWNEDGLFLLNGSYICEEMIGREQPEQIGVTNGKNN